MITHASSDTEAGTLAEIRPWLDPVVDRRGYEVHDRYVETFWLGVIGPTAAWIMRRLADGFALAPEGFVVDLHLLAGEIGVSDARGEHSPFARALHRCVMFGLARPAMPDQPVTTALEVRRRLPQVPARSLRRLPEHLMHRHAEWVYAHHAASEGSAPHRPASPASVSAGMR